MEARVASLEVQLIALERRVRDLEEMIDTRNTPAWKRAVFRLDGWGPWHQLRERPHWRPWRRWFLSLIALVLLAPAAHAAPVNDPLVWTLDEREINQPVDHLTWCLDCVFTDWTTQEPWVVNPTACMWDTDDEFDHVGAGVLEAHTSTTVTGCVLLSGQLIRGSTVIGSDSADLIVTYAVGPVVVTAAPTWSKVNRRWEYRVCFAPGFIPHGPLVEVPGSHGGMAEQVPVTVTVENPTDRRARNTGGRISFGWLRYFGDC